MKITTTIDDKTITAEFQKSEDCGYSKGSLLIDLPSGGHMSVYKHGRTWIAALVIDGIGRSHSEYSTRAEALTSAAEEYASDFLFLESVN